MTRDGAIRCDRPVGFAHPVQAAGLWGVVAGLALLGTAGVAGTAADEALGAAAFHEKVEPVLVDYCYGCHTEGVRKGGVAFDEREEGDLLRDRQFWLTALKNVRAGIMPPAGKPRPSPEQVRALGEWVKRGVLGIDPNDPDPGRVTIRRLNRVEYRNTIRDLMGVDFRADEEFPPDDTGYGFDTIGDVLSVSPLLLEKYLEAAETVVAEAVPTVSRKVAVETLRGSSFRGGGARGDRLDVYTKAKVSQGFRAPVKGTYRVVATVEVRGMFDFDPGRCRLTLAAEGEALAAQELGWANGKKFRFEGVRSWEPGRHELTFELEPLTDPGKKVNALTVRVASVEVVGPTEPELWERPPRFDRFFTRDDPVDDAARADYARETLGRFASRAYRRPADPGTVERLVAVAREVYRQPGKTVEQGLARAMVAVLASPRFLFRVEGIEAADAGKPYPRVDEYALASRLSYFLWSTMPDAELIDLAARGALRANLGAQVKRLLDDPRSEMFTRNFTGQWLQARDLAGIAVDARSVLARDEGYEKELQREQDEFRALLAERAAREKEAREKGETRGRGSFRARVAGRFTHLFAPPKADLDSPLREAMRWETELFFAAVVREDRNVLDLIDADFTFLNERLAKHYGIPGVKGDAMRRVTLPADSPRGGLLTQGTVLVVTSNPTRTSPVKRGLFILDNVLGTPAPPPPADVAPLEDAEAAFDGREPTLRELMQVHREKPLCNACHARMDPLGLALENFNALGAWREAERKQPIDASGRLISGEEFSGVRDLKRLLRHERRADFERCLTEKLLTYALGRGPEAEDLDAVDRIVDRLESSEGRFSALLAGIVESAPFQKRRDVTAAGGADRTEQGGPRP